MEFKPSPQQLLFLWCVVTEPPGTPLKDLPFNLKSADLRKQLEHCGWINVEKVARSSRSKPMVATLTEEGWYGLEQNLTAPIAKGTATANVLQKVLTGIHRHIKQGRLALADVVTEQHPPHTQAELPSKEPASATDPNELRRRLFDACRSLTDDGVYGVRIRLADLRSQLADVPRLELDRALKDLERSEAAALYPFDDPREIRPDDEAAALQNSSGSKRHILYLSRPR